MLRETAFIKRSNKIRKIFLLNENAVEKRDKKLTSAGWRKHLNVESGQLFQFSLVHLDIPVAVERGLAEVEEGVKEAPQREDVAPRITSIIKQVLWGCTYSQDS